MCTLFETWEKVQTKKSRGAMKNSIGNTHEKWKKVPKKKSTGNMRTPLRLVEVFTSKEQFITCILSCTVLQCVAVCSNDFRIFTSREQCVACMVCCSVLQHFSRIHIERAIHRRHVVLQCFAVFCSVLQCVAVNLKYPHRKSNTLRACCVAVRWSVLQYAAVRCTFFLIIHIERSMHRVHVVLQCVAVCRIVLLCVAEQSKA